MVVFLILNIEGIAVCLFFIYTAIKDVVMVYKKNQSTVKLKKSKVIAATLMAVIALFEIIVAKNIGISVTSSVWAFVLSLVLVFSATMQLKTAIRRSRNDSI